jgi:enoyl-CoA hydratase/carnithine racemase
VSTPRMQFEIAGPLAYLTVNRPDARNAMTWDMYEALVDACGQVDANDDVRVFILRAAGDKAFISGTDISQFTEFEAPDASIKYERHLDAVIDRLERVRVPTIAQVQGIAAGGGCAIALACDMRVCAHEALFGVPIARTLGNCLSAANYARIVDLIGPARTKDILFTGRLIDAVEANALGLVTRLAPRAELDAVTRALAESIVPNAPLTLRATKEAVRRIQEHRRIDRQLADDLILLCYTSDDFKEGVSAFLAKRTPTFAGK